MSNKIQEQVIDWNPYFLKYDDIHPTVIFYEKRWYCNENKIIHGSEKEVINCKFCFTDADRKQHKEN